MESEDAVALSAEWIMSAAIDMEEIYTKPAVRFITGLRRLGLTCEQVMAFLLMIATHGHLLQEDGYQHKDDLALALDGLSYALQIGADAIRDGTQISQLLTMREEGNA